MLQKMDKEDYLLNSKTCKNCKYWGLNGFAEIGDVKVLGTCSSTSIVEASVGADLDGVSLFFREELMTGPEFGCIHFEQKK